MVDFKLLIKVKSFSNQFTIPHLPPQPNTPKFPTKTQSIAMHCNVYCKPVVKTSRK